MSYKDRHAKSCVTICASATNDEVVSLRCSDEKQWKVNKAQEIKQKIGSSTTKLSITKRLSVDVSSITLTDDDANV